MSSREDSPYHVNKYFELPKKKTRDQKAIELLLKYLPLLLKK